MTSYGIDSMIDTELAFQGAETRRVFDSCCASLDIFKVCRAGMCNVWVPKIRYKYALGIVYLSSIVHIIDTVQAG